MKMRSCFVSNSSSSSFIIHDMDAETLKEKAIQCGKELLLKKMSPSERDRPNAEAIAERNARKFFDWEGNVEFFDFGNGIGRDQWKSNIKQMAEECYSDESWVEETLSEEFVFQKSKEKIAVMVERENAFRDFFGWIEDENGEEWSPGTIIAERLGTCQPIRMS